MADLLRRLRLLRTRLKCAGGKPKGYDPNEPRDESGEWTSGGGSGRSRQQAEADLAALPPVKKRDGTTDPTRRYAPFPQDKKASLTPDQDDEISGRLRKGNFKQEDVRVDELHLLSHQSFVYPDAVKKYLDDPAAGGRVAVVVLGGKKYIYDGVHRSTAAKLRGLSSLPAAVVNLDNGPGAAKSLPALLRRLRARLKAVQ